MDRAAASAIHLLISGRVQGVGFREATRREASQLGVTGWVRNLADGRVEVVACGPVEVLEKFVSWCHDGPPGADVILVQAEPWATIHQEGFRFLPGQASSVAKPGTVP